MILEGIVTTLDADGAVRISPMGPLVESSFERLVFRPFTTSHTFKNLKRSRQGVFHVTDDVELIARAAVNSLESVPAVRQAREVEGVVLVDACRWYAMQVEFVDEQAMRARIPCRVVATGFQRDFFGFNRAKHAVVEAAILATRLHLVAPDAVEQELRRLRPLVEKTGGKTEHRAFAFLQEYISNEQARGIKV